MITKIMILSFICLTNISLAADDIPLDASTGITQENSLQTVNTTVRGKNTIIRYQQLFKGIPVFGSQVTVINSSKSHLTKSPNTLISGNLMNDIQIDITPGIDLQESIEAAKKSWLAGNTESPFSEVKSELQIRANDDTTLELVYLVSFKTMGSNGQPKWPFFIINAHTAKVIKEWNNIKTYDDSGPGGNDKVHEYWYGRDGLPALNVNKNNDTCIMDSQKVRLVNLGMAWDWYSRLLNAYQYPCGSNQGDKINGAFSPMNDAYYFGHTIVDMYRNWYGLNALQTNDGKVMPLIMRVHFGQGYDNAFWDGKTMSFGDGTDFYPLVSLDVAGHEVTHGFTEQHSGLEYHDEPGALNESLSDMAGQASRAYLLETTPQLYNKVYLQPDVISWGIGETIVRDSFGRAMRFMDNPSEDGRSADCVDKALARASGGDCRISYSELVRFANSRIANAEDRQSYIVHTASGIFNKAFYLLSQKMGIKKAFNVMLLANTNYWTPDTNFRAASCGVVSAANDLKLELSEVRSVFEQVGIDTGSC